MVELVKQNYNENKSKYNQILAELRNELGDNVPINHVGSTAIPDICGKNIIDILIGARDNEEFEQLTEKLIKMSYFVSRKNKEDIYRFFASREEETTSGDIHIHLVIIDTDRYKDFLILKKYLLQQPIEAKKYSEHKQEILEKGHYERSEYKQIKSEYVTNLLKRAREYFQ